MSLNIFLAKKFDRSTTKGLRLKSAGLERAVVFNSDGSGYEKLRDAAEAFRKSGENVDISLRGIGRSYEITGEDTMAFLSCINFSDESVNDFIRFFNEELPLIAIGEPVSLELTEKLAMIELHVENELETEQGDRPASHGEESDLNATDDAEDRFFDELSETLLPRIEKYDIGIIKK